MYIFRGDFNICPKSFDAADENLISNDAIYKDVKDLYKNIVNLGYYDAFRNIKPDIGFTYCDYGQSFKNDIAE